MGCDFVDRRQDRLHTGRRCGCGCARPSARLGKRAGLATEDQGAAVVAFRRSRGRSQLALARTLGVDPGTLRRIERGRGGPTRDVLERLKRSPLWLEEPRRLVADARAADPA